jgi:hypothetical protein
MIGDLWQDLHYGARSLSKRPEFALVAVLTLGIGIGSNSAIFTVVHAVLLRPLPYDRPDRLGASLGLNPSRNSGPQLVAPPDLAAWPEEATSFERIAYWSGTGDFNPCQKHERQGVLQYAEITIIMMLSLQAEPWLKLDGY